MHVQIYLFIELVFVYFFQTELSLTCQLCILVNIWLICLL